MGIVKFQSTLPQGERRFRPAPPPASSTISIHAPTRGATLGKEEREARTSHFNPRSHKGSDTAEFIEPEEVTISIHAPTRGATLLSLKNDRRIKISIHAPTRGATELEGTGSSIQINISIHAPTRGATLM